MKYFRELLLFGFMVFYFQGIQAQESDTLKVYRIQTQQGNDFTGVILSEDDESILLKTDAFGEVRIRKADIRSRTIVEADRWKDGEYWPDNPQSTRYFWTPNGYGLKAGEGYYQNIWVLYNQVSYGITNHFSVSGGLLPLFLFGSSVTPVWVIPKVSLPVQRDMLNLSAGAFLGTALGEEDANFGIVFGTSTFGSKDRNLNIGLGWGYAGSDWASSPVVNISTMIRTSPRGYFISENYFLSGSDFTMLLLSFGGRRMIQNVGLDFALYIPIGTEVERLIAIPLLGVTIPFGERPWEE